MRFALLLLLAACRLASAQAPPWQPLFDGKSLDGWKPAAYRNNGELTVRDGALHLKAGNPFTGVNYTKPIARANYEVRFEAVRLAGNDFFATLTFPVGDANATWVLGGWGGDIVGISSIDDWDASENETRSYFNFEDNRWYALRLKVTPERIQAWIDDRRVVDVAIAGRSVGLRPGPIDLSLPFGFASYNTSCALRKIEVRKLP
jgi:hypothetical protein